MRLGVRELLRTPGRFAGALAVLVLVGGLLVFLGGLSDGLNANNDGAITAQSADMLVFSSTADRSVPQSVITDVQRAAAADIAGVVATGGLDLLQVGARLPGRSDRDIVDIALFSHELPVAGVDPLPPGRVWADRILESRGVERGMTVRVGPGKEPLLVEGFVDGTGYQGQGTLWAAPATFAAVTAATGGADRLAPGTSRVLVLDLADDADVDQVASAVDAALGSATETITRGVAADAVLDIGGGVLDVIVGLTATVATVVVTLFFALLTLERADLLGVLKAVGAQSRTLFAGVAIQASILSVTAGVVAVGAGAVADRLLDPATIPFELSAGRAVLSVALLLAAAGVGSLLCLRRIARTDPATVIGRTP